MSTSTLERSSRLPAAPRGAPIAAGLSGVIGLVGALSNHHREQDAGGGDSDAGRADCTILASFTLRAFVVVSFGTARVSLAAGAA